MRTLHSLHPYDGDVGDKWVTVRRGPKWYYDTEQDLALCECQFAAVNHPDNHVEHIVGHGRVVNRQMISFSFITDEMIANEHEESSRTKEGLLESMKRAYEGFRDTELVTVLSYWRTD